MDKSNILLRLEMLADLCETTEPEEPNDKQLFSKHLIEVQNMITLVTDMESDEVKFNKLGRVPKDHPFRAREFDGAFKEPSQSLDINVYGDDDWVNPEEVD